MQIRNVLQMTMADDDLMGTRSSDLGLDSLISVDIRSWFLKNFEVSVPVLKIMGNDTMTDLAELVAGQVPPNLLPATSDGEASSNEAASPKKAPSKPTPASEEKSISETSSSADDSLADTSTESSAGSTESSTPIRRAFQVANGAKKGPGQIDWDAEIALPEAAKIATDQAPAARPRTIVLTGVSGLLGRHLLSQLLQDSSVVKIICPAVRRLKERLQAKELIEDNRIIYFEGDLEQPRLGLSEQDATQIFRYVDAVIHNGADTSHLKFYPAIKAANAGSTKELIRLSMARKVPIHYLSTVGVALFGNYDFFPEISVATSPPPTDGSHGYIAAKWASERMLEELHQQHGINVWIHRPSTIIREGADAATDAAQLDWMNALVAYMLKTKAVPAIRNLHGALDLVYVKNVTDSILKCVVENKPKSPAGGPSYLNLVGDVVLPLDRLQDFVAGTLKDDSVDVLPIGEWAARAVALGLNHGIAALIESMDDPGQPHYPRMLREGVSMPAK